MSAFCRDDYVKVMRAIARYVLPLTSERTVRDWVTLGITSFWDLKDIRLEFTDTFVRKSGSKCRMDIFESVVKKLGTGSALSKLNLEMHSTLDAIMPKK